MLNYFNDVFLRFKAPILSRVIVLHNAFNPKMLVSHTNIFCLHLHFNILLYILINNDSKRCRIPTFIKETVRERASLR